MQTYANFRFNSCINLAEKAYVSPLPAYSPGGILNAFAWPLTVYRQQRVFIVYCVDYQGI